MNTNIPAVFFPWLDVVLYTNDATHRAFLLRQDTLDPASRTLQLDAPSGVLLLGAAFVSMFGPAPDFDQLTNLAPAVASHLEQEDLESLRTLLATSPPPGQAGVTRGYANALADTALAATERVLALGPQGALDDPGQRFIDAFNSFRRATAAHRIVFSDQPTLHPADSTALVRLLALIAKRDDAPLFDLREPFCAMTAAYLAEEFDFENVQQDPDEWFDKTIAALGEQAVDSLPSSILALSEQVGPFKEGLLALAVLASASFAMLALDWNDGSELDREQSFRSFDEAMARWFYVMNSERTDF